MSVHQFNLKDSSNWMNDNKLSTVQIQKYIKVNPNLHAFLSKITLNDNLDSLAKAYVDLYDSPLNYLFDKASGGYPDSIPFIAKTGIVQWYDINRIVFRSVQTLT